MISENKENVSLNKPCEQGKTTHSKSVEKVDSNIKGFERTEHHLTSEGQKHEENLPCTNDELEGAKMFENPMKEYFTMANQLSKIFALLMGLKLKIFDCIEELECKADSQTILKKNKFQTSSRHMLDLLDQLYLHGYLSREGSLEKAVYKNSDYTKKYLLRKCSDNYDDVYLNLFKYIKHFECLENGFASGLTKIFTEDISANQEELYSYISYFYKVNRFNFDYILNNFDFNKYKKIIDIHGLCGSLASKIKTKFPKCEVVSFENSKLKDMLNKGNQTEEIPKGTVCFTYGDLLKDKLPESDCVIMPHILMHFSKENREKILKMIYDSLRPNGEIIIMENLVDAERSKDSHGLKISFMLGLLGYEGYVMSFEEYNELISSIGFKNIKKISKDQGVSDFICAKK